MNECADKFKLEDDMCHRQDCCNKATKQPVVQLRSHALSSDEEVVIGVKVCDEHATQKDADDLIDGVKAKGMMQDIFLLQRGAEIDWSCSGVVWESLNEE